MNAAINQDAALSKALNQINVKLHSTLDFQEVAQRLLSEGSSALGNETAAILLRDDVRWQVSDVYRMPTSLIGTLVSDQEVQHAVLAIQSRQIVAINDVANDPRVNHEHLRQYNIRAVLVAPLIARDRVIGVMFCNFHSRPHTFTATEIHFSQQLATTAAIALDNARLFNEHLRVESALRASEQRLYLALDAAEMGMWDWDLITDRVLWNARHYSLFGLVPETFSHLAADVFAAIHPDDRARVQEGADLALAQHESFYSEFRVIHPDKSVHWIATIGQRVKGSSSVPLRMIGICFDITERKQAEQERARYLHLENIAQMHRLHTAGEFAALLAHQLNQPLSAIRSFAEAAMARLRHGTEQVERTRQTLTDIVAQSERAAQSIRDLRQFLARQPLEMTVADLNAHVRSASGLMNILARSHAIQVTLDLAKSLPMVAMRPAQIEQVLINLMENAMDAIRHTSASSTHVADTMGGAINGTIQVSTQFDPSRNELMITVLDSGPGLDAETAKIAFDPLYTTKKNGIGMGLTISRSIVEDHGGRIWAEAQPGGCFKFTLPVTKA